MKIIKVKSCEDCIYYINIGRPYFYYYCGEKYRITKEIFKIEFENKIPDWCPWRIIKVLITKSMFHKSPEELRKLDKENDIKLLELLKYMRRRNDKKIKKETVLK